MSLFKARDWWSAALGEGEEFDQGCLCVGDVDNSGTGHGQYVVRRRCTNTVDRKQDLTGNVLRPCGVSLLLYVDTQSTWELSVCCL